MAAPPNIGNIGSMLDRAIAAWLASQNCGYITATTTAQILPANSPIQKSYPCIIVHSQRSTNTPQFVGNKQFSVKIMIKQSAVTTVADLNAENARVILDQLVGQCLYAMLQSNDGQTLGLTCSNITAAGQALATSILPYVAQNNADMATFSLQNLWDEGQTRGEPSEPGASWVEVLNFESVANPTLVTP